NAKSFGHQYFKSNWRGLEPPRHLHLFSPQAAEKTAEKAGFTSCRVWTTIANAGSFAYGGEAIRNNGRLESGLNATVQSRIAIGFFRLRILFRFFFSRDRGEECVVWAIR